MSHVLHVSAEGKAVGQLTYAPQDNQYGFRYADEWVADAGAFYLAPAIPLRQAPVPGAVHRFLENLLPEGRALDVVAHQYALSKNNTFSLIHRLGKEPVGAFAFAALNATEKEAEASVRAEAAAPVRRAISDEELTTRIRTRDLTPFSVWDGKARLSLAGYQDKLQVIVEQTEISLADGALSSTHLLKPDSRNAATPCMVANEHFCMTLAASIAGSRRGGYFPVAPVELRRIPEPILLIERFDRVVVWDEKNPGRAKQVRRLHAIDGCQALDVPSSLKYERNLGSGKEVENIREGVSFERLFGLLDIMETPAQARVFFLRWALLQLIIGNSDAHGKNISFFVGPAGLSPAPMYDLVSVNAYGEKVEQDMAMGYGDVFLPEAITPYALADFAHRTGTGAAQLSRELTVMARIAAEHASALATSALYIGDERDMVHKISTYVQTQAAALSKLAPEIAKVKKTLLV